MERELDCKQNDNFEYRPDELLPHSDPMILIDRIIACDENMIEAEVVISEVSLFLDDQQVVPIWVGIEYMAQTVAAFSGYQAKKKDGPVKVGFLLGTRKFKAHERCFEQKQVFKVRVEHLFDDQGLGSFDCKIMNEDEKIYCEAKINAYQPDNIEEYLASLKSRKSEGESNGS